MNPRYAAFKKLNPNGKNWEFMNFISQMKSDYLESIGCVPDSINGQIHNHDEFTAFIEAKCA